MQTFYLDFGLWWMEPQLLVESFVHRVPLANPEVSNIKVDKLLFYYFICHYCWLFCHLGTVVSSPFSFLQVPGIEPIIRLARQGSTFMGSASQLAHPVHLPEAGPEVSL